PPNRQPGYRTRRGVQSACGCPRSAKQGCGRGLDNRKLETMMQLKCGSAVMICLCCPPVFSQSFNFNFAGGPGFPLNKTSDFANVSYHFVAGVGPNLFANVKMNAEFMFHGLPVSDRMVNEIGASDVKGRCYALTGNLILGHSTMDAASAYIIAGGGWYRRTLETKQTVLRRGEMCAPVWTWWNVE